MVTVGWSKRAGLRAGFGAVIAVLILSAFEAYRIQVNVSRQHLEIYRHFVETGRGPRHAAEKRLAGRQPRPRFLHQQQPRTGARFSASTCGTCAGERGRPRRAGTRATAGRCSRNSARAWRSSGICGAPAAAPCCAPQRRGDGLPGARSCSAAWRTVQRPARPHPRRRQTLLDSEGEFAAARRRATRGLLAMLGLRSTAQLSGGAAQPPPRQQSGTQGRDGTSRKWSRPGTNCKQLSARLLEIEEEGRRRLSRELHDEIGQTLALLQIEISHARQPRRGRARGPSRPPGPGARTGGTHRADHSQYVRAAASGAARRSRPGARAAVPAGGFPAAQRHRLRVRREDNVADDLPDAVKTCVYRVVQEALHNAEKHSGATRVKVSVRQYPDRWWPRSRTMAAASP